MSTETDMRLRTWLDANQRDREQMCRAIVALDARYTEVRPRHPMGGPDGGRDIEALLDGTTAVYGAVGFQNGANDSGEQLRKTRAKFQDDLDVALNAKPDLKAFVFLTNLHLTIAEQSDLKEVARARGITHCDILDRERLRIELDTPGGFFIRFQYLAIPLSEAEQASFLSRYGDRIQQVVSTGFQRIERTLDRLLFLQEAEGVLGAVHVHIQLRNAYPAAEIGHFRAFVNLALRAVTHNIWTIWFGSTDQSNRFRSDISPERRGGQLPGIANGVAQGAWEMHFNVSAPARDDDTGDDNKEEEKWTHVSSSSSIGIDPVHTIPVSYIHDQAFIRYQPRLQLRDLDNCMFVPVLNRSLADRVHSIRVFANGYQLADIGPAEFSIDSSPFVPSGPGAFTAEELQDPWVRIRPANGNSVFRMRFTPKTPKRVVGLEATPGTGAEKPG